MLVAVIAFVAVAVLIIRPGPTAPMSWARLGRAKFGLKPSGAYWRSAEEASDRLRLALRAR